MDENIGKKKRIIRRISSIIGVLVCLILAPLLIMNITIIAKSYINPDKVPDFFGIKPFVVLTDSMEKEIYGGDIVITRVVNPKTLKVGDIISFKEGNSVVTHRIEELISVDGESVFVTKGDANNGVDQNPVTYQQVEGIYLFKIEKLGSLAMFMQTPVGMLVFIGIPLCGFIIYDILRRRLANRREFTKENEAQAEIDQLKAQLSQQNAASPQEAESENKPSDKF